MDPSDSAQALGSGPHHEGTPDLQGKHNPGDPWRLTTYGGPYTGRCLRCTTCENITKLGCFGQQATNPCSGCLGRSPCWGSRPCVLWSMLEEGRHYSRFALQAYDNPSASNRVDLLTQSPYRLDFDSRVTVRLRHHPITLVDLGPPPEGLKGLWNANKEYVMIRRMLGHSENSPRQNRDPRLAKRPPTLTHRAAVPETPALAPGPTESTQNSEIRIPPRPQPWASTAGDPPAHASPSRLYSPRDNTLNDASDLVRAISTLIAYIRESNPAVPQEPESPPRPDSSPAQRVTFTKIGTSTTCRLCRKTHLVAPSPTSNKSSLPPPPSVRLRECPLLKDIQQKKARLPGFCCKLCLGGKSATGCLKGGRCWIFRSRKGLWYDLLCLTHKQTHFSICTKCPTQAQDKLTQAWRDPLDKHRISTAEAMKRRKRWGPSPPPPSNQNAV